MAPSENLGGHLVLVLNCWGVEMHLVVPNDSGNIPFPATWIGTTTKYLVEMSIIDKPTPNLLSLQVIDEKQIHLKLFKQIRWNMESKWDLPT